MNSFSRAGVAIIVVTALTVFVGVPGEALAAKKVKAYNSQTSETFVNEEGVAAYGLVVSLSSNGEVILDAENAAGPFRNVSGNGNKTLTLTNPTKPVAASGDADGQVTLKFQSYSKGLRVTSFYWTDVGGKRIGKKKKL